MKQRRPVPSKLFLKFFRWYCHPKLVDHIEGDLLEEYGTRLKRSGKRKADIKFAIDVLLLFRPGIIRPIREYKNVNTYGMYKSYFTIGWRNLLRNKGYSFINIGGLATGMAVTILIGLWAWDELSYDKNFNHYNRIGQVWQFVTFDVEKASYNSVPIPLAEELRDHYPDFEQVSLSSYTRDVILANGDQKLIRTGNYVEPSFNEMMSLKMVSGVRTDLTDINSVMLSRTLANDLFGSEDALNKTILFNGDVNVKVTGIYEDFPDNSSFKEVNFLAPWSLYASIDNLVKNSSSEWDENSWQIFVQLREGADFERVSEKIRDIRMMREDPPRYKPEFFVHPMEKWHLNAEFRNGINTGGLITFVWLFSLVGLFVLILACINFMNLATARSEKRTREIGIRKSIGSVRSQLILQFLCESLLTVFLSFVLALILVQLILPFFNEVAGKQTTILWTNPWFWITGITFCIITGLLSGSYPALYLSSFQPVKVLKGTFRPDRLAAFPRKILVVFQFTVSVTLMIGIVVVFLQIDFARTRPTGYDRGRLIEVLMINTAQLRQHHDALRSDLLNSGTVYEVSQSLGSITSDFGGTTAFSWRGKVPNTSPLFMANKVTHEFGRTVGWEVIEGRDFSRDHMDERSMIINESAAKLMDLKDPIGEMVTYAGKEYKVIGVVRDIIKESPFTTVKPSFFVLDYKVTNVVNIKLAEHTGTSEALARIEEVFRKYDPAAPFDYTFVDERYAQKFSTEERIAKLSGFFAVLSIVISCLGVFGLASFMAEQRTKEISVRKVMGASVFSLWKMLSKDFVGLVVISCLVAIPLGYYLMDKWLQKYPYRIEISWVILLTTGLVALTITILTVSYQSVKAALMSPVKNLRSE